VILTDTGEQTPRMTSSGWSLEKRTVGRGEGESS